MNLHQLLPLVAFLLNLSLAVIVVMRNPRSRLNRVFAYFVGAMAVWNVGAFMLRRAADPPDARLSELIIHAGVVLIPAFYYHFVLIFLDSTTARRRWLTLVYAVAVGLLALDLSGSPLFLTDVRLTAWGWAPVPGPVYFAFLLFFNGFMIGGLVHLMTAYRRIRSSFRRNRTVLILFGTFLSVFGGAIDFVRFIVARRWPAAGWIYPVGIPANMLCALMLGISIARYRMFEVHVAVKKTLAFVVACGVLTGLLVVAVTALQRFLGWREFEAVWVAVPLGFALTVALHPVERLTRRLVFSNRAGCYETLLALSGRMTGILDFDRLVDTLVRGLVKGIPLTHCVLLMYDARARSFVVRRRETSIDETPGVAPLPEDAPLVQWLRAGGTVLVKEEVKLNPRLAEHLAITEADLEQLPAALIVPLKIEKELVAILLLGEKLSGEVFDGQEIEVLSVLAAQAAVSLENARLYDEQARLLDETRRQHHEAVVLEQIGREIASSLDRGEVLQRIVDRARELCGSDVAYLAPRDREAASATVVAVSGMRARRLASLSISPESGRDGAVLETGETFVTEWCVDDPGLSATHAEAAASEGLVALAIVPLRFGGQISGLLAVANRAPRRFTDGDLGVLAKLADQAAIALENSRLFGELRAALKAIEDSQEQIIQGERLRALGEMAGGVAHDFNNTLAIILGRAQLLLRRLPAGEMRDKISVIERVARDGAQTVKRIQEFTRKHRARPFEWVDVNRVVEEVIELTRSRWEDEAQARGVRYDVGVTTTPLPAVAGDPAELREALTNLVFNALDAMPDGGTVRIGTWSAEKCVACSVTDSGIGMTEDVRRRVFEPFFTTKGERGTGLGLSVVYGIIKRHHGDVTVESAPGSGSTFTFTLPLDRPVPEIRTTAAPTGAGRTVRVLVVDDEVKVREILTELLTGEGHTVVACEDGPAGLAELSRSAFDLVITDLGLPGLSGWDVARIARVVCPNTPIVLLTGWRDLVDPEDARSKGIDFVLSKPFVLEDVLAVLSTAVG